MCAFCHLPCAAADLCRAIREKKHESVHHLLETSMLASCSGRGFDFDDVRASSGGRRSSACIARSLGCSTRAARTLGHHRAVVDRRTSCHAHVYRAHAERRVLLLGVRGGAWMGIAVHGCAAYSFAAETDAARCVRDARRVCRVDVEVDGGAERAIIVVVVNIVNKKNL